MTDIETPKGSSPLRLDVSVVSPSGTRPPLLDHVEATAVVGVDFRHDPDVRFADVAWILDADVEAASIRAIAHGGAIVVTMDPSLVGGRIVPFERSICRASSAGPPAGPGEGRDAAAGRDVPWEGVAAFVGDLLDLEEPVGAALHPSGPVACAVDGARAIVGSSACCVVASEPVGTGEILWLGVLPREGIGFDLEAHVPLRACIAQLLVDEILATAFLRRHGLVARRLVGPYGRPMRAWQAHVEEERGLCNGSMEAFVERLAESREVPTFSMIRRPIRWGHRTPGLVHLPEIGRGSGRFDVQPDGPSFFSGRWIRLRGGSDLGFAPDPNYREYYDFRADQPRAVPAAAGDGRLVVGAPDGRLEIHEVEYRNGRLSLVPRGHLLGANGEPLCLRGASPTLGRVTGDGTDLLVADDGGRLALFVERDGRWHEVETWHREGRVTPRLCDWSGDGGCDLLLGTEDGRLELARDFRRQRLASMETVLATDHRRLAPAFRRVAGTPQVVVGTLDGSLHLFRDGRLEPLGGRATTMRGTEGAFLQQDAAPEFVDLDGESLLLCGASVVGIANDDDLPASRRFTSLRRSIARLQAASIPITPHVFFTPGMDAEAMTRELDEHRALFERLGLPWSGNGSSHHCWIVPRNDVATAFRLERASGLVFDFGWQPPAVESSPDGGPEFALSMPFFLRDGETASDFLLACPSVPGRFPAAERLRDRHRLPVTHFVHPEFRKTGEPASEVDGWVAGIEQERSGSGAVAVTEPQMARAVAAAIGARFHLHLVDEGVRIDCDPAGVPAWARAWVPALAVGIERADGRPLQTDAAIFHRRGRELVSTVDGSALVSWEARPRTAWNLSGANQPVHLSGADPVEVSFAEPGLQELLVDGADGLCDWPGASAHARPGGRAWRRFGAPGRAVVRTSRPPGEAMPSWVGASRQDEWVADVVFAGRTSPGWFVETGAADGTSSSATLVLEREFGWRGLLVEPNEALFRRIPLHRKCLAALACVTESDGSVEFIQASWFGRILDHASAELAGRPLAEHPFLGRDLDGSPARVVRRDGLSLATLLRRYEAPRDVDFAMIDAEWSEWFILRRFPFRRWNLLAICVNTKFRWDGGVQDSPHAQEIRDHLVSLGYFFDRERSRGTEHDFFVHPRLVAPPLRRLRHLALPAERLRMLVDAAVLRVRGVGIADLVRSRFRRIGRRFSVREDD